MLGVSLMLIFVIVWWVSKPAVTADLGLVRSVVGGGCVRYGTMCAYRVTTDRGVIHTPAQPFSVGEKATLKRSNRDGLQFCAGALCGRAFVERLDEPVRSELGFASGGVNAGG